MRAVGGSNRRPAFAAGPLLDYARFLYDSNMAETTTASVSQTPAQNAQMPIAGKSLLVRRLAFLVGMLGFAALYVALRPHLPLKPLPRSLLGVGVLVVAGAAAFFLFGRETQRRLQVWRIVFSAWALLLAPLLITIAFGLAEEGWPQGRFNKPVARLLIWIFITTIPAFLTGLTALIRTYRLTAWLAMLSGLSSLCSSYFLFVETAPIKLSVMLPLTHVLNIIGFFSKLVAFAAIPVGIASAVGGFVTLRAARQRTPPPTPQDHQA